METIAISEFRSNLMKVLRAISLGEKINITSRGKVIAKLVPPDDTIVEARKRLSKISKKAVLNNLISPIETKWDILEE